MSEGEKSTQTIPELEGEGWNWFDQANEPLKQKREEDSGLSQEDYEAHFAKVFSGKSGEIVMGYLASYVMAMPGFDQTRGFYDGAATGFYRTGMQDLVQHIHAMKTKGAKT